MARKVLQESVGLVEGGGSGLVIMQENSACRRLVRQHQSRAGGGQGDAEAGAASAPAVRAKPSPRPVRAKHSPRPSRVSPRPQGRREAPARPPRAAARERRQRAPEPARGLEVAVEPERDLAGGRPALSRSAPSARFSFGIGLRRIAVGGGSSRGGAPSWRPSAPARRDKLRDRSRHRSSPSSRRATGRIAVQRGGPVASPDSSTRAGAEEGGTADRRWRGQSPRARRVASYMGGSSPGAPSLGCFASPAQRGGGPPIGGGGGRPEHGAWDRPLHHASHGPPPTPGRISRWSEAARSKPGFLTRAAGRGTAEGGGGARAERRRVGSPPPPCFAWSPSPVASDGGGAARDGFAAAADAVPSRLGLSSSAGRLYASMC